MQDFYKKKQQQYQENAEVIKAASHVASKVSYERNTELKTCVASQEITRCSPRSVTWVEC